jgi:hypothetical protein
MDKKTCKHRSIQHNASKLLLGLVDEWNRKSWNRQDLITKAAVNFSFSFRTPSTFLLCQRIVDAVIPNNNMMK